MIKTLQQQIETLALLQNISERKTYGFLMVSSNHARGQIFFFFSEAAAPIHGQRREGVTEGGELSLSLE